MLKKTKASSSTNMYGAALEIRSAADEPLYAYSPEVVSTFRHMLTGLNFSQGLPRRLAVTSALRGEGVTYTTLALSSVMANDAALRVCAVELNWWSPGLQGHLGPGGQHRGDGPSHRHSLAEVLTGKASLDEALIKTSLPNLSLLPAGELDLDRRPVLARSDALKELLDQLDQQFDHLLLDVPAVLATSDSIALASLSDACCVVVRQGVTPASQIQQALDDIRHLKMLGVVLNQVAFKTPRWIRNLIPQE